MDRIKKWISHPDHPNILLFYYLYALSMISVCMLTKNAEASLAPTLESLIGFSEVVILDNGSSDKTLEIAKKYPNVRIEHSPFIGFGPLRNLASKYALNDWILAIDSDEILSPPLLGELSTLKLDSQCVYSIPRHNYYNGKRIRGCGWDPERVVRLYHRKTARYADSQVHESLESDDLKIISLKSPLLHTPYRSTSDFLSKMQHYSTLFANQSQGNKKSSLAKAIGHGFFAFFKSYILKRGCFCGREGFIISVYNGNTAFYKYLKLRDGSPK